jgi:hypothetical protein
VHVKGTKEKGWSKKRKNKPSDMVVWEGLVERDGDSLDSRNCGRWKNIYEKKNIFFLFF